MVALPSRFLGSVLPVTGLLVICSGLLMSANVSNPGSDEPVVVVGVDPRVELFSIVFRVAGASEYRRAGVPDYAAAVDHYFAPYADESAVRMVRELRKEHGISHDAVVKLAVHVEDEKDLREVVPLKNVDTLGTRWLAEVAREFLEELREFSRETRFPSFFLQQRELFELTEQRLRDQLEEAELEWLDEYFGETSGSLRIVPGMLTGRTSYGATVLEHSMKHRYAIVGVNTVDEEGKPLFDRSAVESVVHELCHSYVKPMLDENFEDLRVAAEKLHLVQQPRMEAQGYRDGYTVMNETLTRACCNRYLQAKGEAGEVEKDFVYNRSRGFLWIEAVANRLAEFESNRQRYATFAAFAPELVELFDELTGGLPGTVEELDQRRPHVVESVPGAGDTDVDPELELIEVTFDRPMRVDSWSVVGGGPKYPETGIPSYDETGRVFRLPVSLAPDREYELWFNRGPHCSFASEEGIPLESVHLRFQTGSP